MNGNAAIQETSPWAPGCRFGGGGGLCFLLLTEWIFACSSGDTNATWDGTIADSAGVKIVSNTTRGLWGEGEAWTVEQDLVIGQADGNAAYLFGEIAGIGVASDGRIAVLDQQASEIKVYDTEGVFEAAFGNPGNGPGELGPAVGPILVMPGDTLLVPDIFNMRVNRYTIDGSYVGSFPRDLRTGLVVRWEVNDEGQLLAQFRTLLVPGQAPDSLDGLVAIGPGGSATDTLLVIPSGKTVSLSIGEDLNAVFTTLAPEPAWASGEGGHLLFGVNDQYRIGSYDRGGRLQRLVSKSYEPRPLAESDKTFYRNAIGEFLAYKVPRFQFEQIVDGMRFAEFYPAYLRFWNGPDSTLWVQHALAHSEMSDEERGLFDLGARHPQVFVGNPKIAVGAPGCDVFDAEGRFLGVVTLPARFDPLRFIGEDIYGVWRDELDVEYVVRLKALRGENQDVSGSNG